MTGICYRLCNQLSRSWHYLFCRHGHGIHSPFAYNLIRNVIGERHPYYIYREIERKQTASDCVLRQKDLELLYRLSLHRKPHRIATAGNVSDLEQWVLQQGADGIEVVTVQFREADTHRPTGALGMEPEIDLLYLAVDEDLTQTVYWYNTLLPRLNRESVAIVSGMKQSPESNRWWNQIRREAPLLSFDLYHFGLLYYNPTLTKGHHRGGY